MRIHIANYRNRCEIDFYLRQAAAKDMRKTTMGRISTKKDKTVYQQSRESLGLSRDKASELLEGISSDRIERIENETSIPLI